LFAPNNVVQEGDTKYLFKAFHRGTSVEETVNTGMQLMYSGRFEDEASDNYTNRYISLPCVIDFFDLEKHKNAILNLEKIFQQIVVLSNEPYIALRPVMKRGKYVKVPTTVVFRTLAPNSARGRFIGEEADEMGSP
jgi:hypothetical protein